MSGSVFGTGVSVEDTGLTALMHAVPREPSVEQPVVVLRCGSVAGRGHQDRGHKEGGILAGLQQRGLLSRGGDRKEMSKKREWLL